MLDVGIVPQALLEQLDKAGWDLNSSAGVEQLELGKSWTITDYRRGIVYNARNADYKLNISIADKRANDSIFHLALLCQATIIMGTALIMALPFAPSPPAVSQSNQPGVDEALTVSPLAIPSPTLDPAATVAGVLSLPVATPIPNWRRLLDNHLFLYDQQYDRPAAAATDDTANSVSSAVTGAEWELGNLVLVDIATVLTDTASDQALSPGILILNFGPDTDLTGWHLRLGDRYDYEFGSTRLDAGEALSALWRAAGASYAPGDGVSTIDLAWENITAALPIQLTLASPENIIVDQLEIGYPAP